MVSHFAKLHTSRKVDTIGRCPRLGGNKSVNYLRCTGQRIYDKSTSIGLDQLHQPQS